MRALFENRLAVVGFVLVILTAFAALAAPWIAPQNPYDLASSTSWTAACRRARRAWPARPIWLGTDDQGRDMLSAILYGLRISLDRRRGSRR